MVGRGVPSVVAVLIGMAAGCGPDGDTAGHVATPHPPANPAPAADRTSIVAPAGQGSILGHVLRDGGRDPRSGGGQAATSSAPVGGDPVQVRTEGGEVVAQAVSSSDGTFQLALPPGRYLVSEDIAGVSQPAQVAAGTTTDITLLVPGA